ncbi:MAG: ferredoxin [Mariprofundales bacterium]
MMMPSLVDYQRHVLLCAGKHCDQGGERALWRYLKAALDAKGIGANRVRINRAGCLGVCTQGAIMCVYPEAVWYCRVDEDALDRIVDQHFIGGEVVESLLFHRNTYGANP